MKRRLKGSIRTIRSSADRYAPKTPLNKVVQLCGRYKCDHVFVKDESKNRHGTFKDRRNAALLAQYAHRDIVIFVHITNGNSGYSLGQHVLACGKPANMRPVVNVIDRKTPKKIKDMLESCSDVVEMDLSKGLISDDDLRRIARKVTKYEGPEDNIVVVENYRLKDGYGKIVHEIAGQLEEQGKKPDYIFCPVGGGELATEVAAEAQSIWGEDAPKIIGVTVPQNVLVRAKDFIKKVRSSIADKISCGHSKFKDLVQNFVEKGRIELTTVKEKEIATEYRYLNGIGINVEPSAAVAFVGAAKYDLKPEDVVIVINSGKGIYDQNAVERIWIQKLKRGLRYAAVFLLGAGIALGLAKGYLGYKKVVRSKLEAEALYYAYEKGDNKALSLEAHERLCRFLRSMRHFPPQETKEEIQKNCKTKYIWDLPDGHLRFYVKYKKNESLGNLGFDGGIWASKMRDLTKRYQKGEFGVKVKDPSKGLKLIGK
jgi:threonine dehydratase